MSSDPADVEVADPDNYTTSQRLKQIYEARRQLRQMRREASTARHRPGARHSKQIRAIQHYRTGLESYLLEVDTLLRQFEPGPELWHNRDFGTITVHPPGQFTEKRGYYVAENINRDTHTPLKVESIPDPKHVDVVGLKWLFETETPVRRDFEYEVVSHRLGETKTLTGKAYLSWEQLNQMATSVNSFLGELGIGLDVDDTNEWTI
jgi:hypothetical protein